MTDEQRLQMITDQLILVRDNLFRGLSKSMQKLQARSINEVLELPNHTQSPPRTWVGLTDEEIDQGLLRSDYAFKTAEAWRAGVVFAMTKLKEKNSA